jgi:biotin transport system substrate-specific component
VSATAPSIRRTPVLADVLPGARARDVALVLLGAALTALCAQASIRVPPSPVPITGQTFGVIVVGASLGAARGGASQLLYVLAGLALPVYAAGAHGWDVVVGATGGYLIAFPIAAYAVGRLAELGSDRRLVTACPAYIAGQLIVFGIGVPWAQSFNRNALADGDPRGVHDLHRGRADQGRRRRRGHPAGVAGGEGGRDERSGQ